MIIDTHAHLDFSDFEDDREDVVKRANDSEIKYIINVGTSIETSRFSIELAEKHAGIYASAGVHPHDSNEIDENRLSQLRQMIEHPKVVAIGEIGLDYYRNYQPVDIQKRAFELQIQLALSLDLPVIIHDRQADRDIIEMLTGLKGADWKGVFHCFPGDIDMARRVLDLGFHISFTGVITFKSFKQSALINYIPLDKLLLETDCPFMAPVPFRGKRNEPAYVQYIGQKIAEIKNLTFEEVAQVTTRNALRLFQIQGDIG